MFLFSVFFTDTATTEIYTLSLHDALPIFRRSRRLVQPAAADARRGVGRSRAVLVARAATRIDGDHSGPPPSGADAEEERPDRKSTRLNSSHEWISYAVFCLKKKKRIQ